MTTKTFKTVRVWHAVKSAQKDVPRRELTNGDLKCRAGK